MRTRKVSAALQAQMVAVIAGLCSGVTAIHAQSAYGQAESASPSMTLAVPNGMPLELTAVESFPVPAGPNVVLKYTLRNTAARAIVACTIRWGCYHGAGRTPCGTLVTPSDCWDVGQCFSPSQEKTFSMAGPFSRVRLEGMPVYVEFDNGEHIGRLSGSEFSRMTKVRQAALDEYKRALVVYTIWGEGALTSELAEAEASAKTNEGRARVGRTLLYEIKEKGMDAAVLDLKLKAQLRVSQYVCRAAVLLPFPQVVDAYLNATS